MWMAARCFSDVFLILNMEKLCQHALPPDFEDESAKEFYLCVSDSIEDLSEKIDLTSKYYALFLAIDARNVDESSFVEARTISAAHVGSSLSLHGDQTANVFTTCLTNPHLRPTKGFSPETM